ncbi:hypothetical protein BDW62DRAFT_203113 [Aspergillus aurantiobrunneus]
MRDCMKIYHRFECYNIYRHVVEAGLHTGTHWIRDLRTALAHKLCQDFTQRFHDQKAANKSLNWVDHGCKYRERASLSVCFPHPPSPIPLLRVQLPPSNSVSASPSRYTSRCTKERIHAAVIQLKSLGIDTLVKDLELSALGEHIAATLRDMTGRKRKGLPGKALNCPLRRPSAYPSNEGEMAHGSRKSPRVTSSPSLLPSSALAAQPAQNPTPPESLAASTDGNSHPPGAPTSVNICRSIAEDYAVPYNDPSNNMDMHLSPSA